MRKKIDSWPESLSEWSLHIFPHVCMGVLWPRKLTYISVFKISIVLVLYLEIWWCFCDQKHAVGMWILFLWICSGECGGTTSSRPASSLESPQHLTQVAKQIITAAFVIHPELFVWLLFAFFETFDLSLSLFKKQVLLWRKQKKIVNTHMQIYVL